MVRLSSWVRTRTQRDALLWMDEQGRVTRQSLTAWERVTIAVLLAIAVVGTIVYLMAT